MVVPHLGDSVENVSSVLQINSKSQTPNVHEERALCLFKWEEVTNAACSASSVLLANQLPACEATEAEGPTNTSLTAQGLEHITPKKPAVHQSKGTPYFCPLPVPFLWIVGEIITSFESKPCDSSILLP